jgi:hypothetical protein
LPPLRLDAFMHALHFALRLRHSSTTVSQERPLRTVLSPNGIATFGTSITRHRSDLHDYSCGSKRQRLSYKEAIRIPDNSQIHTHRPSSRHTNSKMQAFSLILVLFSTLSLAHIFENRVCPADDCNRAVTGTRRGPNHPVSGASDCRNYMMTTLIVDPV